MKTKTKRMTTKTTRTSFLVRLTFAAATAFQLLSVQASRDDCTVVSKRCDFPFTYEGTEITSCQTHNSTDKLVCGSNHGNGIWSWGICNEQCLEDDGTTPMDFSGEMQGMAFFCKNEPIPCKFPFKFMGVEYDKCTDVKAGFPWCAIHTNEDGNMIKNMWGICDQNCFEEDEETLPEPEEQTGQDAEVQIDSENVTVEITFQQVDNESPMTVRGTLSGFEPGSSHVLYVYDDGNCSEPLSGAFSDSEIMGELGKVIVDSEGQAIIDMSIQESSLLSEDSILNHYLVVEPEKSLAPTTTAMLPCGLISPSSSELFSLTLIIIIVLAIIIVLLLILITVLICYCVKKNRAPKNLEKNVDYEGLPLQNGGGSCKRTPLYDELSIPFIDATPAPTPKLGRSIDRLSSFFTRNPSVGRSRGSLSSSDN